MHARKSLLIVAAALLLVACGSPEQRAAAYMVKAQQLYDAGDYVQARLQAQNAMQVQPKNTKARYLLALVAEQEKDYKKMFAHLLVAVDGDPTNIEARLKLGTLYFLGEGWPEAAKQADELLKLAPKDPRVHLLHARVLIQRGARVLGLAEVATALKLDPDNVEAILLLAADDGLESVDKGLATVDAALNRLPRDKTRQLRELRLGMLQQAKRTDEVEVGLLQLSRDFPEIQDYQVKLAQFYAGQGRVDDADKVLKTLADVDAKDANPQLIYVQFLVQQGSTEKAESALKAFILQNPKSGKLHLALGELYETSKRPAEARKVYAEIAESTPKSAEGLAARNRIAALDLRDNNLDAARERLASILKDAPDNPDALLLRSGLNFAAGKFANTISDLRAVLRKVPGNDRALLLLAQAYVQTKDIVLAKDTFRLLLDVSPDDPDGLRQLAALDATDKDYAEAEALLRKRLAGQADDLVAASRLVEVLLAQGSMAKAEAEARRMAALTNQAGVGDFSLGRVLAQKKDYAAAAEAFRKAVAARPGDPLPLEGLVQSLQFAGRQREAISFLKEQLDNSQNQLFARFLLGGIYGRAGEQARAESYLEEVLRQKPELVLAWESLASIYKERKARIAVYERALKTVPGNPDISMLLTTEFEMEGRFDVAMSLYEGLLKADPKYEPAINNLAALLLDQRTDDASHARALELAQGLAKSENPALLDTLGWAHYRAGQYPEAVSVLERVVAKAGQFPVFRYHLGMAYLKAGNRVGARQQLVEAVDKAQSDYPGMAEARATLEQLDEPS